MFYALPAKAPVGVKAYGLKWADWLGTDTIVSVDIELCTDDLSGVVLSNKGSTDNTSFCTVSGGLIGMTAKIEHTITTMAGDVWAATILVAIVAAC